ncbi:hypothetical protein B0H66DRAFT_485346 [Apodospora peruviana]|uniref:Uncharacterized protein n=1 Tax=Apodospora peruviana TaxID=516989 RepID=A0AAE0LYZ9_9PEZI|nr:hypothetical protein B0H66DRAFT_485346 [Apodospora peruviana]
MELARVDQLVDDLTSSFEAGLEFYVKWKKKLESRNHYRRHDKTSSATTSKCAVSTSLDISSHRIRATYQVGSAILGSDFTVGDAECRQCLTTNLAQLETRVASLRDAFSSKHGCFINLNEVFLASEAIRIECVTALADQYRRFASGRPVPQEMPIPRPRPISHQGVEPPAIPPAATKTKTSRRPPPVEFDRQTAVWSTNSDLPVFKSEPPSPPLTPKLRPDDTESCFGPPSSIGAPSTRQSLRPKNSVFSIFCAEAMALQVDPNRPLPSESRNKCKCGYKWKVPEFAEGKEYIPLKDGFRMTKRFLAKSHCDQSSSNDGGGGAVASDQPPKPGYGCVLCTSTGRTETYETADNLRTHINVTHGKWQMLHDRDVA